MNIIEFIEDPLLLADKSLSPAQKMALKVVYGLALDDEEMALFKQTTGRSLYQPGTEQTEAVFILGRRSGKSDKLASNIAVYEACGIRQPKVSVGERPVVMIVASEKERQAKIVYNYVLGKLEKSPVLKEQIKGVTADTIELQSGVSIQIFPAQNARVRGASILTFIGDEAAFWKVEGWETDKEILEAARPGLSFEQSKLILISTPYAMKGEIYRAFKENYGRDGADVLVIKGPTELFNPGYSKLKLAAAKVRDKVSYRSEFEAEFRTDLSAMFEREVIEAAANPDRPLELAPRAKVQYVAFVDPAGGGGKDSYAIAIAHKEGERIVIDVLRSREPRFNPVEVSSEYAALVRTYGISRVVGDRYSGEFASTAFASAGVRYDKSEKTKSELYVEAESAFNTGRVEIPNRPVLIEQLTALVRRARSGGKDWVDVEGGHDDDANVCCGALWLAGKAAGKGYFIGQTRRDFTDIFGIDERDGFPNAGSWQRKSRLG